MSGQHEEYRYVSGPTGWILIILLCAVIIGWGYLNYFMIHDTPGQWKQGALPDVPGESIYSTDNGPSTQPTRQVNELPEARPYKPVAPGGQP